MAKKTVKPKIAPAESTFKAFAVFFADGGIDDTYTTLELATAEAAARGLWNCEDGEPMMIYKLVPVRRVKPSQVIVEDL